METLKEKVDIEASWKKALQSWNQPAIPYIIVPKNQEEREQLGEVGQMLEQELAFMKYPEFQTYANLEKIVGIFPESPQRGMDAIAKHEAGHRFCPYDTITMLLLRHAVTKTLEGKTLKVDKDVASGMVLNVFADLCINTASTRRGDQDIAWAYRQLCQDDEKKQSPFWRVYGRSMELAWKREIMPQDTKYEAKEIEAAQEISKLFEGNYFDKSAWRENIQQFTHIISDFLEPPQGKGNGKGKGGKGSGKEKQENESSSGETGFDDITQNIPKNLDEKTTRELAKRLAEIGSDGLPKSGQGLKEFQEIMAGFGQGDPVKASIEFYDLLSNAYEVRFATRPFGTAKVSPFQPIKWQPSLGAERLDVPYSLQAGGRLIPGVNTYAWNTRRRETKGLEEVVPNLDLYLDSSGSMLNPVHEISLPVLAGFVVAKKAHRKGVQIRATNFSGKNQYKTAGPSRNLREIFEVLVTHYNGGTVFPTNTLLDDYSPKQVLVITDTFLGNENETANAITELKSRHKGNRVTIYSLHDVDRADYLRNAGAEIIPGTSTDIFKRVIGKADEVYAK